MEQSFLRNETVPYLVKDLPAFYGIRKYPAVFTKACHFALF